MVSLRASTDDLLGWERVDLEGSEGLEKFGLGDLGPAELRANLERGYTFDNMFSDVVKLGLVGVVSFSVEDGVVDGFEGVELMVDTDVLGVCEYWGRAAGGSGAEGGGHGGR